MTSQAQCQLMSPSIDEQSAALPCVLSLPLGQNLIPTKRANC